MVCIFHSRDKFYLSLLTFNLASFGYGMSLYSVCDVLDVLPKRFYIVNFPFSIFNSDVLPKRLYNIQHYKHYELYKLYKLSTNVEPRSFNQRFYFWFASAEPFVKYHRVFGTACLQQSFEFSGYFGIKNAFFFKIGKRIGI